jgi:ATP adenylyltransferase
MLKKCTLVKSCINESDAFFAYAKELRDKIRKMFRTSPHLMISKIEDEFYIQNGIKFLIKLLKVDQISKKPKNVENKPDPFAPPFDNDYVIEDDFAGIGQHRVIFNKYPIMDEHILLTTREFKTQSTHLVLKDFQSLLLLSNMVNGFIFFNGGLKSGSTQPHKHIQCIPLESLYNGEFGIFELINDETNLLVLAKDDDYEMCTINKFTEAGIPHRVTKFRKETSDYIKQGCFGNMLEISHFLIELYKNMLSDLDLYQDEENIVIDYSFLYTSEWMFLVPRNQSVIKIGDCEFSFNSASYTLSLLVRSEEQKEELKKLNILDDIFNKL